MPDEVLEKSFADENARQITLLRYVLEHLHEDMNGFGASATGQNDKTLKVCAMLINQTFGLILRKLDDSPAPAAKLSGADGVELDHITFDKGRVRMVASDDTIAVRIYFGIFAPPTPGNQ